MVNSDHDFPKLQSPFKRKIDDAGRYVVSDEIDKDYLWVFEAPDVIAVEKLDGTNVSIVIEQGKNVRAYNRMNPVPIDKNHRLYEGVYNSHVNGWVICNTLVDGQYFGELIGPGIQNNPMNLKEKRWIPFESFAKHRLKYDSWDSTTKNFDSIRNWMKNEVRSIFFDMEHGGKNNVIPEGVVFYRLSTGEMAKLRNDMFDFWYDDPTHRPHKYPTEKPPKNKAPNPMVEEIATLTAKEKQGLLNKEDFIKQRNEILLKYGIIPKEKPTF